MSDSLKDQLIALGLAKKGQDKPKGRKASRGRQADRTRKRRQAEDRRRQRLNSEIRSIVEAHRMNDDAAELTRNFLYKGRIRKVMVTPDQLRAINDGELGVAYLSGGYHILAPEHLEAVRKLSPEHVPDLAGGSEDEGDHPVPDDLVW